MKETTTVSGTFQSQILTDACGVAVTLTFTGSIRDLKFPDRPVGPQDLSTFNIAVVATAGSNQVRFENAGLNLERVEPDGTVISQLAAHRPVEFTGVLKVNLETDEVILQSHHLSDIPRICQLLTG